MPDFLPLFPLKIVVFPNEKLNLHIFEPRYKQLIRECENNNITFGIPAFIDNKIMDFGTEIELLSVEKKYESGEMDVKTRGLGIFKIHEFYSVAPNKLYSGADIQRIEDNSIGIPEKAEKLLEFLKELFRILNIDKSLPQSSESFRTYAIAHHVGFSVEQEYEFLKIPEESTRQDFMFDHLQKMIPVVKEMERLRQRVQMNGHYKNVIPPEI